MSETTQIKTSIRNLSDEDRKRYYRENKRKSRLKNKICIRCGSQATIKTLNQEYLCDLCDRKRLVEKFSKKKETPA